MKASTRIRGLWAGLLLLTGCTTADVNPKADVIGLAGAQTRLTLVGSTLYTVDGENLRVFDVSSPTGTGNQAPQQLGVVALGVPIETLQPAGSFLLVGTQRGTFLYDISTPTQPRRLGVVGQALSCNPLAVDGRWAYMTQREGSTCGSGPDQLQIIDLHNPAQPTLTRTYPLPQPYGLAADSNYLYVCAGGLKVFDTSQAPTLTQLTEVNINAFEVQVADGLLLVDGHDVLYQYHYDPRQGLRRLSAIPVNRP